MSDLTLADTMARLPRRNPFCPPNDALRYTNPQAWVHQIMDFEASRIHAAEDFFLRHHTFPHPIFLGGASITPLWANSAGVCPRCFDFGPLGARCPCLPPDQFGGNEFGHLSNAKGKRFNPAFLQMILGTRIHQGIPRMVRPSRNNPAQPAFFRIHNERLSPDNTKFQLALHRHGPLAVLHFQILYAENALNWMRYFR